jgi:hypothetical protein
MDYKGFHAADKSSPEYPSMRRQNFRFFDELAKCKAGLGVCEVPAKLSRPKAAHADICRHMPTQSGNYGAFLKIFSGTKTVENRRRPARPK